MHYVYILKLKDESHYVGYSDNLKKRIFEHSKGLNFSTKHWRPFNLIYYEVSLNEKDAKAREKYLKGGGAQTGNATQSIIIPARLNSKVTKEIQDAAVKAADHVAGYRQRGSLDTPRPWVAAGVG